MNVHGRDPISAGDLLPAHAAPTAEPRAATLARALAAVFAFGVATDSMPLFGIAAPAPYFGAILALAAALHVVRTGQVRRPSATLLLLTGFVAWSAVTLLWARSPSSPGRLVTYLQLLLSIWLLWQLLQDERDLRAALGGFVAGCVVVAAGAWQAFLSGVTYVEAGAEPDPWVDEQRYVAAGFDPNDMGVTLALGIPMAVYLALRGERRSRFLWALYAPFAISGISLSGSRGAATTAVVAGLCVLWWIGRRSVMAMAVAFGLLVVAGTGVWTVSPESLERIVTAREQVASGGSVGERLPIWRSSAALLGREPVAGVGVGAFSDAVAQHLGYAVVAHNTIISVAVEGGVVGLLLFAGAFGAAGLAARRSAAAHRALAQALLLVWAVGALSLSWEYRKATWFLLLVGAALAHLRARDEPGAVDTEAAPRVTDAR